MLDEYYNGYYRCVSKVKRGDIISVYLNDRGYRCNFETTLREDCLVLASVRDIYPFKILIGSEDEADKRYWVPVSQTIEEFNIPGNIRGCYFLYPYNCLIANINRKGV
jgi:hypothetical protein